MEKKLSGKKVAILATNGFEESEFNEPIKALKEQGAEVNVVSPEKGKIKAWKNKNWGGEYDVDITLADAKSSDYDALVLPGGVMNPDQLRTNKNAVQFAKEFLEAGKPIAAICHGPWTLIESGLLQGRKMTSWPSLQTDLKNAGVNWVDQEVVVDQGLVTSRKPDDLPSFCKKMIEEIAEGKHQLRRQAGA